MKECVKTDMDSELHVFQRGGGGGNLVVWNTCTLAKTFRGLGDLGLHRNSNY